MLFRSIKTDVGTVLHTGDWKIDPTPVIGQPTDERRLRELGDEGVLALTDAFHRHGYPEAILFGHALEGNLHFVFPQGFEKPGEVERYQALMDEVLGAVRAGNRAYAIELAALPMGIRGYGHVKAANAERARERQRELLALFRNPPRKTAVKAGDVKPDDRLVGAGR